METQSSSLSWVAQAVLLMLADSRTGATATQLSGQMFLPKDQVDDALGELAACGHARRNGRRWRAVLGVRARTDGQPLTADR
jgi:DNA-binding IclR family transcriptional regulator